ncbi:MAG: hypothetical protein R3E42_12935 [Burkholderiaceae bacterium]
MVCANWPTGAVGSLGASPPCCGLSIAVAGSVWAALANSLPSLTAARALQGPGAPPAWWWAGPWVQDLYQGPQRTRVMAYVGMVMGLCPPLATVIGGQLHVHLTGCLGEFCGDGLGGLRCGWRRGAACR